jgi:hypothetical protein
VTTAATDSDSESDFKGLAGPGPGPRSGRRAGLRPPARQRLTRIPGVAILYRTATVTVTILLVVARRSDHRAAAHRKLRCATLRLTSRPRHGPGLTGSEDSTCSNLNHCTRTGPGSDYKRHIITCIAALAHPGLGFESSESLRVAHHSVYSRLWLP